MINRFNIKVPTVEYELSTLSGGNMQKVILARELELEPEILVAAQPTRGVDIGAIESIRKELVILRDKGKAILLVSSELEEIMSLSDRIAVVYEGEIVGYFRPEETTEEELGLYMAGAGPGRSERNMI
jgi:simple sugar transport system ATP-binding protein